MWKELGEKSTWTWCEDEASGRANVHIAEDQADPIISIMLLASLSASLVATSTPLIPRSDSQGHKTSAEEYRIRRLDLILDRILFVGILFQPFWNEISKISNHFI